MERKKQRKVQSLQSQGRPLCPCVRPAYSEGGELVTVSSAPRCCPVYGQSGLPAAVGRSSRSPRGCSTRALQTRQPRRRTMLSVLEAGSPPSSSRWGCFWYPSGPACSSVPYGHSFQSKSDYGQPGGQALKPCGVRLSMCVPEGPQEPLEAVTSPSPWSSAPGKERFCCRSDPRGSTSQRPCRWRSGLRDSGRGPGSA
ncbi:uncharacterized protein LOC116657485 isoform X3 [Camelus ferus]|uniref:Uncharacterized protein LOC116657485 isoform X3 n=1 Tax=Camelus ferus TaxID=419612 RepID=A0A8B8RF19_CAMFR|nr:uncharacterized protein LOC116657485 isoform X3 [Camelus ferus]